jgi:hypothetical protein
MCMASVSLWAEATWYRLTGAGQAEPTAAPASPPAAISGDLHRERAGQRGARSTDHELVGHGSR